MRSISSSNFFNRFRPDERAAAGYTKVTADFIGRGVYRAFAATEPAVMNSAGDGKQQPSAQQRRMMMLDQMTDPLRSYLNATGGAVVSLLYVLTVIAWWRIFTKAGEAGWKSLIPFYNVVVLVRIADGNGWKALLFLVPIVGEIYAVLLQFRLAQAFGKGLGFGFGLVFLNTVFLYLLAFGDARYAGDPGLSVVRAA